MNETTRISALKRAEVNVNRERTSEGFLRFEVSSPEAIERALSVTDLTGEDAPAHIVNIVENSVVERLSELQMGDIRVVRDNPIVPVEDNFDKLLFPADNAGRSSTYTRYADEDHVLRTHTSAHVPETFSKFFKEFEGDIPDMVFAFPGLVYRRDVIDKKHLDVFHQLDIWTLRKDGPRGPVTSDDLLKLVDTIFDSALPGKKPIVYPAVHPYTVKGIEVYAEFNGAELEVLEAGLAHPEVLRGAGFDPTVYSGLALGMGIDRLVMSLKGLSDIRYLRSKDMRIASQMLNGEKFKDVSNQPPITRDMSYCVPENYTDEDICEEIKEAFGHESYLVEDVKIAARTKYANLPQIAKDRLGALHGQDNVLVKIMLRHPDKTLTRKEADGLYDQAYPKLNKGTKGYTR